MPRFRRIFIILFTVIMTGLFLAVIFMWRQIGAEEGTRKAYIYLLSIIFALLITLFAIVLYNFDQRKRAERRYRESETKFSLLVRNVRDLAIFMVDPAGCVMSWNQGAERIKGYKEEEIVGKPIDAFYLPDDVERGEPATNLRRAREEGRYESLGWRRRKDGSLFFADVLITPLYDDQGRLRGYAKITRDITEKKKAEEDVQRAFQREHELNEMKSRFVSMASHEFKTPLSVILSSASLLEKYQGPGDADKRERHLQRIKSNVSNLRQILNDFLSVEQLEKGIVPIAPSVLDLPLFLKGVIQNVSDMCKSGQRIELRLDGPERKMVLDVHLLENILINLLSNAIKYSGEDSLVEVIARFEQGSLSIAIKDSGIGIPEADQPRLFEEFFRAGNATSVSGTGLGLSIVRKYVHLMEGTIGFTSVPGIGSEFMVTVPSRLPGEEETSTDHITHQVSSSRRSQPPG